jgi:alkaline phosphatase
MGNVVIDMSMSLDGYIAAPNDTPEQGLARTGCGYTTGRSTTPRCSSRSTGTSSRAPARSSWPPVVRVDVLLGGGRRLFDQLPQRVELEQTGRSQTGGVTHLEYRVVR